jgi:ClpP class serine protease
MNDFWLLSEGAFLSMMKLMAGADIKAAVERQPEPVDSDMVIEGGVARIPITGIMTKSGNGLMSFFFGHSTSYNGIIDALAEAQNDPHVESVLFDPVDGPGGHVNGAFEAAKAIRNFSKPTKAIIRGEAASATYMLASQADEVIVQNEADQIGSIGVVTERTVSDERVVITSRNAPLKRPDVSTSAGVSAVQDELDQVAEHMVKAIAAGRDIAPDVVNSDFGKGSTMTADRALRMGMVDSIGIEAAQPDSSGGGKSNNQALKLQGNGGSKMSLATLLAAPENAAALAEHNAAVLAASEKGKKKEHDRACAHLAFAATSPKEVIAAIKDGTEFGQATGATYMAATAKVAAAKAATGDNADDLNTADDDGTDSGIKGKAKDKQTALEAALDTQLAAAETDAAAVGGFAY